MVDPLDLQDVDTYIEQVGGYGGFKAQLQAVQYVVTAQMLRREAIGEGDLSDLYLWYKQHLVRIHNAAMDLVSSRGTWAAVPFHMGDSEKDYENEILVLTIRAILQTLPEVHKPEEDELFTVALPKNGE